MPDGNFRQVQEFEFRRRLQRLQAIQDLLAGMSHLQPHIPSSRSAARNGKEVPTEECQRQRYALPYLVYPIAIKNADG